MEITSKADFDAKVRNAAGAVFVDFFASWCGPCRMYGPIVEELKKEVAGKVAVYKVNVDTLSEVAGEFRVQSIPTTVIFEDGKPVETFLGARQKDELLKILAKWL
jgi:thioredoxin 1